MTCVRIGKCKDVHVGNALWDFETAYTWRYIKDIRNHVLYTNHQKGNMLKTYSTYHDIPRWKKKLPTHLNKSMWALKDSATWWNLRSIKFHKGFVSGLSHKGNESRILGYFLHMGVSKNNGTLKWMMYRENPIKMDDWGAHPYFWKHPYIFHFCRKPKVQKS